MAANSTLRNKLQREYSLSTEDDSSTASNPEAATWSRKTRRFLSFSLVGFLAVSLVSLSVLNQRYLKEANELFGSKGEDERNEFRWEDLVASEKLDYTPCHDGFQCAKLKVPLDWLDTTDPRTAEIAIIKLPADIEGGEDSEHWAGPILANPGGPGAEGVGLVQQQGKAMQEVTGRNFSIIGFDPRGVGETRPIANCFNSILDSEIWSLESSRHISSGGPEIMGEAYARGLTLAQYCSEGSQGNGSTASYSGTAYVARDMLRISELSWKAAGRDSKGLQYWGFSYGTLLGQTFAQMFPDKVHRLVLDGVVDVEDYYSSSWKSNLVNTNKSLEEFYVTCAEYPETCALSRDYGGKATAKSIELRVNTALESLRLAPLPLLDPAYPDILTYSFVRWILFGSLYMPLEYFPKAAEVIAAVEKRDGKKILDLKKGYFPERFTCKAENPSMSARFGGPGSFTACGDGDPIDTSFEHFQEYYKHLAAQNTLGADIWVSIMSTCIGWKPRAKERIRETFGKKTKSPILFIGNDRDPVTPLENAMKASKAFTGSGLLRQKSGAHCSTGSPSLCTASHIRSYFENGTLPPAGTACDSLYKPFEKQATVAVNSENQKLIAALMTLSRSKLIGFGLPAAPK